MSILYNIILLAPAVLIALTVHEFSHALVAYRLGDPTAKAMGRLTLNPFSHLDLLGTLCLILFKLGWAKPVPVDARYFRHPRRDMMLVAFAGPASNFLLALLIGLIFRFSGSVSASLSIPATTGILDFLLLYGVLINLTLAFFNLIPIPPLDGSKILQGFLPVSLEQKYIHFLRWGPLLLIALIFFGDRIGLDLFGKTIFPLARYFSTLFAGSSL
jgi:Zn-dependent protease